MWHVNMAEVFTEDDESHPVAIIRREAGGFYTVEVQPNRTLAPSTIAYPDGGLFQSFDDALNYGLGN